MSSTSVCRPTMLLCVYHTPYDHYSRCSRYRYLKPGHATSSPKAFLHGKPVNVVFTDLAKHESRGTTKQSTTSSHWTSKLYLFFSTVNHTRMMHQRNSRTVLITCEFRRVIGTDAPRVIDRRILRTGSTCSRVRKKLGRIFGATWGITC